MKALRGVRQALSFLTVLVFAQHALGAATGKVSGVATDAGSGGPLQGVGVSAVQGSTTVKRGTTDAAGAYTLSSLAPGTYNIVASKSGYASKTVAGVSVLQNKTTTVNVALTALPPTTGQISGTITDSATLAPVAGATVKAKQGTTVVLSVVANASGQYLLASLAAGTYDVETSALGYATRTANGATVAVGATTTVNLALTAGPLGTRLASVSSAGVIGNGWSSTPSVSGEGRYVAFESDASNLMAGDTNGVTDIFVHDFVTGVTERVSVATGGTQATGASSYPAISPDGRFVAFVSAASNLVSGDRNKKNDVFLRDRTAGTTILVSKSTGGTVGNNNSGTYGPSISSDGRCVAFTSGATNLVAGDTNNTEDVFVFDRVNNTTELVSKGASGIIGNSRSIAPGISADGRYVAFQSGATNLVAGDTNSQPDVFLKDRVSGTVERVTVSSSGAQANGRATEDSPSISADGRFAAFSSYATNLAGSPAGSPAVYVRDRQSGTTELLCVDSNGMPALGASGLGSISADGRFVAFLSVAANLATGDGNGKNDIFVRDRLLGVTTVVSVGTNGAWGNDGSYEPAMSSGGRFVAFSSYATNLVTGDTNSNYDVLLRDYWGGSTPPVTADHDWDGVTDDEDACPGTPSGHPADANGCAASQRDSDVDGVKDDKDLCPSTPAGQAVDANGCAATQRDTDGDGVTDDKDLCPNTPSGQPVDANGCAASQRDSDGDGVKDDKDLCPSTASGQPVDTNGCAASQRESDGDGVKDDKDLCPGTPAGQLVDANGCSVSQNTDTDGDGVSNFVEDKLGTDPANEKDFPALRIQYEYDSHGALDKTTTSGDRP